jgi:hypothetical protein
MNGIYGLAIHGQSVTPIRSATWDIVLARLSFPVLVWLVVPPVGVRVHALSLMKIYPPEMRRELWACGEPRWCEECERLGGVGPAHDPNPCAECEGAGYLA